MDFSRQRKFESRESSRGLLQEETSAAPDSGLIKASVSYLMFFSIGVAPQGRSYIRLYVAHLSRTVLWTIVLGYGLARTTYFLSLLTYSGVIRLVTLDGLDDAAYIICCLVLLSQSYSTVRLDERISALANNSRRRPIKSHIRSAVFRLFLLCTLLSSCSVILLYPEVDLPLPPPAPRYITTTEATTTTKRSNLAAGGGGPPGSGGGGLDGGDMDIRGGLGGGLGGLDGGMEGFGGGLGSPGRDGGLQGPAGGSLAGGGFFGKHGGHAEIGGGTPLGNSAGVGGLRGGGGYPASVGHDGAESAGGFLGTRGNSGAGGGFLGFGGIGVSEIRDQFRNGGGVMRGKVSFADEESDDDSGGGDSEIGGDFSTGVGGKLHRTISTGHRFGGEESNADGQAIGFLEKRKLGGGLFGGDGVSHKRGTGLPNTKSVGKDETATGDNDSSESENSTEVEATSHLGAAQQQIEQEANVSNAVDSEGNHNKADGDGDIAGHIYDSTRGSAAESEEQDESSNESEEETEAIQSGAKTKISIRHKRDLVPVSEDEVRNTTSRRILDVLRDRGDIANITRCVIIRNFVLLSAAFAGALCWTVRGHMRALNRSLKTRFAAEADRPASIGGLSNIEEELSEAKQIFLYCNVLQRTINRLYRNFALLWTAIVLVDIQLLVHLLFELPSISLATYPIKLPLRSLVAAHLLGFCCLHAFFTEGAERLRAEFAMTVHLVCVGTAVCPESFTTGALEQTSQLVSVGTSTPFGLTVAGVTAYSRAIGFISALCAIFSAIYALQNENYILQPSYLTMNYPSTITEA